MLRAARRSAGRRCARRSSGCARSPAMRSWPCSGSPWATRSSARSAPCSRPTARHDAPVTELAALRFDGTWRHYQALALEAFEHDRVAGRRTTHLGAPPGSGKTLLGFEILRRLGAPALVLAPSSAIQAQWTRTGAAFGAAPGTVAAEAGAPVACLTYQAIARLDDPGAALRGAAEARWAEER